MSEVYVATYGSLRRGMGNARVNEMANATFVGKGLTNDNFDLFRYGGGYFPSVSLADSESGTQVVIDVWETDMDGLTGPYDGLEGYPSFYNRTQIEITMDDGTAATAWIYHIDRPTGERVPSGDWCTHKHPNYYEEMV